MGLLLFNFKLALRTLYKNRLHSIISLLGLPVGFTAFILIGLFVDYMLSYDNHHENYDRIYRVQRRFTKVQASTDGNNISPHTRGITKRLLEDKYPEIEKVILFKDNEGMYLSKGNGRLIYDELGIIANQEILDLFSFDILAGRKDKALVEPYTIVLSKTLADKLFKGENPIGKTIIVEKKYSVKVTAVFKDWPKNSHLRPSYIISQSSIEKTQDVRNSMDGNFRTYVLLREGEKADVVNLKIRKTFSSFPGVEDEEIFLCPLSKVYLSFNGRNDWYFVLNLFWLIGIFILILAAFNYINLTTSTALLRTKEIAIKKVNGSGKSSLLVQLLLETFIISMIAIGLSIVLTELILPVYNSLINEELQLNNWRLINQLLFITLLVGLASGIYPAYLMTSHKILSLFKGNVFSGGAKSSAGIKKGLVTFQFAISIILLLIFLSFTKQIRFMLNSNAGYCKDNLLYTKIKITKENPSFEVLKGRIMQHDEIENVSFSKYLPIVSFGGGLINWEGSKSGDNIMVRDNYVCHDYLRNMGMTVILGRDFSKEFKGDEGVGCIINQTALKGFGWKNPIGKTLNDNKWRVVGVVKDYAEKDMYNLVEPSVMVLSPEIGQGEWCFSIRVKPGKIDEARKVLTEEFEAYFPQDPFEFRLYINSFESENSIRILKSLSNSISFFVTINILLAIVGLLGLVSFTIQRRIKEIGIRKINGCSTNNIFILLTKEYMLLFFIACVLAIPTAYYITGLFPSSNKQQLSIVEFLISGGLVLIVILATSSYKTIKASMKNPVETLKYE